MHYLGPSKQLAEKHLHTKQERCAIPRILYENNFTKGAWFVPESALNIPRLGLHLIRLGLIFDLLCALFGLMGGFVRGALAGPLDVMPGAFGSLLRRLSRMPGRLFSIVPGIFHILFCAFLWERKTCRSHCNQQNYS